jgi:acetoacetyl-CoA synthetase
VSERVPTGEVLWNPPSDVATSSVIGRYLTWLAANRHLDFTDYQQLWTWTVTDLEGFWSSVSDFFQVRFHSPPRSIVTGAMPATRWFEGATLNYAEQALAHASSAVALIGESQTVGASEITWSDLAHRVARVRAALGRAGVKAGDRVAAYLPNIPETIVAFLATASLGAIWSSCAPEFGVRAVVDRFSQIEPKVLLAVDGYRYGSREIDLRSNIVTIRGALASVEQMVLLPYLHPGASVTGASSWSEWLGEDDGDPGYQPVPFDHPLYILFSSGTTGLPKPIVHSHGGIVLEHLKALALQSDIGSGDRFLWFTTTGWMMWNYLISGLLVGATLVLFDGDPSDPDLGTLWRLADRHRVTWMGLSAPFLMACRAAGLKPGREWDLRRIRAVGSTGAPLPAEGSRWVYDAVGSNLMLSSISGGTDVCTAFVGGCPLVPVWAGEISCRFLGARVEAYDPRGRSVVGEPGELVISAPMPSMPLGLWGDADGSRYRRSYFDFYPGVWRHGDWITITERGSCVISGRSDATLNRGGVRIGTAEFYSVLGGVARVIDSLVVHLDDPEGGPGRLILLTRLSAGAILDEQLADEIRTALLTSLSPRHVPDEIYQVAAIPTTLSGKKLELPVKRILMGATPDEVASRDALADPASLDQVLELRKRREVGPGQGVGSQRDPTSHSPTP